PGGNMVSLVEACELVGADAIRWVVAKADLQEIMYFGWPPFEELKRKILVLWNTYKFFVSYANLDGFDPSERAVPVTERPLLDRWLLSSQARLVADCRRAYEAYDVRSAILKIEAFWDELSTWYVRRNRRRFWKARSHGDALAAYQTLYEAIVTLAKLFAPVMPFLAEELYQNLVREVVKPDLKVLGPKLGKDLPRVRRALAEGRYERQDGRIRVEGFELGAEEVLVSHEGVAGHAVARDAGATVALETALTPDLEREGLARELAHHLNNLRKEAGLDIADRIVLRYDGPIADALAGYREFVAEESLATSVTRGLAGRGHAWKGELNG